MEYVKLIYWNGYIKIEIYGQGWEFVSVAWTVIYKVTITEIQVYQASILKYKWFMWESNTAIKGELTKVCTENSKVLLAQRIIYHSLFKYSPHSFKQRTWETNTCLMKPVKLMFA